MGRIFWNNGTQSKFKQNELRFDTTNENPDETESGMLHSVISYMLWDSTKIEVFVTIKIDLKKKFLLNIKN